MKRVFVAFWAVLLILLCPVLTSAADTPPSRDRALSLFVKAGFAYKDGDYNQAADLYNQILREGLESGALYFNLANSYYKKGDLGRAVLNYERARSLLPRDSDVLSNYKLALSRREKVFLPARKTAWQKILGEAGAHYTINELTGLLLLLFAVFGSVRLAALFLDWPGRRVGLALGLIGLAWVLDAAILVGKIQSVQNRAVVVSPADAAFEPRREATVYFSLKPGEDMRIMKSDGPWVKIERADKKSGWVPADAVERL